MQLNKILFNINHNLKHLEFYTGNTIFYEGISKAEFLGRLFLSGFDVVDDIDHDGYHTFICRKISNSKFYKEKKYGSILPQYRIGLNGKIILIYKIRTMYPYSEYIQSYMIKKYSLENNGKIKNDFRITKIGKILRRYWIDEIPMIYNLIRGDIKLVGCRPITQTYSKLYPKDFLIERNSVKPGLFPCLYIRETKSFNDIIEIEKEYIKSYKKNPFFTDLKYLLIVLKNIVLKGFRSK